MLHKKLLGTIIVGTVSVIALLGFGTRADTTGQVNTGTNLTGINTGYVST